MNYIRNFIRTMVILIFILIPIYVFIIVPKYPDIDNSLSEERVIKDIFNILEKNTEKFSLENMHDKRKLEFYRNDFDMLGKKMSECKDKDCFINEYNIFLDKWVTSELKASTRFIYISNNLGFVGNIMNQNLFWLYTI